MRKNISILLIILSFLFLAYSACFLNVQNVSAQLSYCSPPLIASPLWEGIGVTRIKENELSTFDSTTINWTDVPDAILYTVEIKINDKPEWSMYYIDPPKSELKLYHGTTVILYIRIRAYKNCTGNNHSSYLEGVSYPLSEILPITPTSAQTVSILPIIPDTFFITPTLALQSATSTPMPNFTPTPTKKIVSPTSTPSFLPTSTPKWTKLIIPTLSLPKISSFIIRPTPSINIANPIPTIIRSRPYLSRPELR